MTSEVALELELIVELRTRSRSQHNCFHHYTAELAWPISRVLELPSVDEELKFRDCNKHQ
jgi:hypothetical protein